MNSGLHRKIRLISLVFLFLSLVAFVFGFWSENENLQSLSGAVFMLTIFSILTDYYIRLQEMQSKKMIRRFRWYSLAAFGTALILIVLFKVTGEKWDLLMIFFIPLIYISLIQLIFSLFLNKPDSFRGTLLAMIFILIGIAFKRLHFPGAGAILTLCSTIMGLGIYAAGLACLFWIPKNNFLKKTSFIGSCLLALAFFGFLFKIQHWPGAGVYMLITQVPIVVMTIIFLLMLPNSGYFSWNKIEKRILGRILIPWVFCLFLISTVYIFPKASVFKKEEKIPWSFQMFDYTPENKNGLEPE